MKVIAPESFSWVTPLERGVEKGEEVDVDAEVGEQLVAQGWDSARAKAARRTGRKRKAEHTEPEDTSSPEHVAGGAVPDQASAELGPDESVMPPASEED